MSIDKVWKIAPPSPLAAQLARETGLTPLQTQLLINRGIKDPQRSGSFMNLRLADISDPMLFKGMDDALAVILRAIDNQEKIVIYGDYDADGLTATALLLNFFTSLDIPVSSYIPNRLDEGYGLNAKAIEKIAENGAGLIITVDCGSSNDKEIALAKSLGMKVVVTDHHQISDGRSTRWPMINPHQLDCPFPFKDLAGVGLAFFLAIAIRSALRVKGWFQTRPEPDLREYLDIVALGTVADRVPLLGQNRILVNSGMAMMTGTRWVGIEAMKEVADVGKEEITAADLAFRLAPRLNAPGRMDDPGLGIEILTTNELTVARDLAEKIDLANRKRQSVERNIISQIEEMVKVREDIEKRKILFWGAEGWHKGVLGIVASRLVDRYYRPSLVYTIQDGIAVGSGRSIDGFNLYEALSKFSHYFEKCGGHAHAVGFTLKSERIDAFKSELEAFADNMLTDGDLVPTIEVDAEISLKDMTFEMVNQTLELAPFGEDNPEPVFLARTLDVLGCRVVGGHHLKLSVGRKETPFDAIWFRQADKHSLAGKTVDIVFNLDINRWMGQERIQLRIIDLRVL